MAEGKKHKYATNICGKQVKLARIEAELNQLQLATIISEEHGLRIDQNSISLIEKGERFVKDFELDVLAKVLEKHPMRLLYGNKIPKEWIEIE